MVSVEVQQQRETATRILSPLLYTPRRLAGETCDVCTTPVTGENRCHQCRNHVYRFPGSLADLVVPITYASDRETPQIRYNLRLYKDGESAGTRDQAAVPISWIGWYFASRHLGCIARVVGQAPTLLATVPSGAAGKRGDGHPVAAFAKYFPLGVVGLVRVKDANPRLLDPTTLRVEGDVRGHHVIVLDDTWTTGASAQSAAVALRRAGASHVTIVTIGRWTNNSWDVTADFFKKHPRPTWSPASCPVTGADCPV